MTIPGEDYLASVNQAFPPTWMTVLDLVAANFDTIALVTWSRQSDPPVPVEATGSALIRFDPLGKVLWQTNLQLCHGDGQCRWGWEAAALVRTPDGVIVAGNTPAPGSWSGIAAARFTDAGNVVWVKHYRGMIRGAPAEGQGRGIVRVHGSLDEQYLIETWFFEIDGAGNPAGVSYSIPELELKRLRATPTQGIFAVGGRFTTPGDGKPWIVNLDPGTAMPRWERLYSTSLPDPPPETTGPVWYDIAEGASSLVVVGNSLEGGTRMLGFIASLELDTPDPANAGTVRWARTAAQEHWKGHLLGIANLQFDPIPITSASVNGVAQDVDLTLRWSAFAICGDLASSAWLLMMMEDGTIAWQKVYSPQWPFEGWLTPIIWPSYSQIVTGGLLVAQAATTPPPRAIVVSSRPDPGRGLIFCSKETHASFPSVEFTSERRETPREELAILVDNWSYKPLNPLPIDFGCPPPVENVQAD